MMFQYIRRVSAATPTTTGMPAARPVPPVPLNKARVSYAKSSDERSALNKG